MADGQLAINTAAASAGVFLKNAAGNLVKVGPVQVGTTAPNATPASGGQAGNSVGEQWLDTSGAIPVLKVWDGTSWEVAGAAAAGSANEIQYNDGSGGLAASADFAWDDTAKELGVGGDINLDDGGSFSTTVQCVTPTANRTISFPNATGTVALVAGSSGQLLWNNAGANAGASTLTYDGSILTTSGRFINSYNATASSPAKVFTGTWFTGGTSTTTKPHFLVEPTGTTSTAWSTSGTGLGVNAASGFAGNLLDLQVNGTRVLNVNSSASSNPTLSLLGNAAAGVSVTAQNVASYSCFGALLSSDTFSRIALGLDSGTPFFGFGLGSAGRDVFLFRDAANTFAQRNGTNAQTFRVYNTFTDASNYERGFLRWSSNVFEVGPEAAGTGTARPMRITAATLKLPNLPTYADNTAALAGGLVAGDVYKTAAGDLRITV
jgi:hypothetical protein